MSQVLCFQKLVGGKGRFMNRRKHDRYFIEQIPLRGIGSIVEVSRTGCKILKEPGCVVNGQTLSLAVDNRTITAEVRWEDKVFIGLTSPVMFNDPSFIIKSAKRVKEAIPPPQMKVTPEKAVHLYKKDEMLTSLINLLMEVESAEPDIRKIGMYIDAICVLKEKEEKAEQENTEKEGQALSCKDELIARAVSLDGHDETVVKDIGFAITRLGLDTVREIIRDHVRKRMFRSEAVPPLFPGYEKYTVLKSTVFKNLCVFFGHQDFQPEGSALLSVETAGTEMLVRESSGILEGYYKSVSRLYAEVSRMYERALFGVDPLQINAHYFDKILGAFAELAPGYVLAHSMLNPHYTPSDDMKLQLTKNGLLFSDMACLTFLAVAFMIDKDRESGFLLAKRLRGKGMDERKINALLDKSVNDATKILRDIAVKGSIGESALPDSSFTIEGYLGKDIRFAYLLRSFTEFSRLSSKRMALRYEDPSYAHFLLGRLMATDGLDLNKRTVCVVPCRNVSADQWYGEDFSYFDLLIFKDVNKLSPVHLSAFMKLWGDFEGQIIATFSCYDHLDYTDPRFHEEMNDHIVDFPSYFYNDAVYRKMLDHVLHALRPYLGEQKVDIAKYEREVHSMKHVKSDILLTKEIS